MLVVTKVSDSGAIPVAKVLGSGSLLGLCQPIPVPVSLLTLPGCVRVRECDKVIK